MTGLTVEGKRMTEMVNGESQGTMAPASVAPAPVEHQAPAVTERTFRQSEVNELIGRAKNEAVERYRREASMASHQQPIQHQTSAPAIAEPDIRKLAAEEMQKLRTEWTHEAQRSAQEQEAQRIASDFFAKVNADKSKFSDYDKVLGEIDLRSIPYHVQLAATVDNTAAVMYELAKNPTKLAAIQTLIDIDHKAGRVPKLALAEMRRLSESIKENEKAAKFQAPKAPLSKMPPSNAGTGNTGPLTVSDYRKKYRV